MSKGEDAIAALRKEIPQSASSLSLVQVDLNSDASLEKAIESISSQHGRLDSLVNNGGGSFDSDIQEGKMTLREGFNATWDLNVSGTHVLTSLAVPLLLKSADPRIVFITSGTSTLAETEITNHPNLARLNANPPAGWPKPKVGLALTAYRSTKTGLNSKCCQISFFPAYLGRDSHQLLLGECSSLLWEVVTNICSCSVDARMASHSQE